MIPCTCPTCNTRLQAPDDLGGRQVKCPCGETLRVPVAEPERADVREPEDPRDAEPWFFRFVETYAEVGLALGGIACLVGWVVGSFVLVQLGVHAFVAVTLLLLICGLAFAGAVFWTALVLVVLDGPDHCGSSWNGKKPDGGAAATCPLFS